MSKNRPVPPAVLARLHGKGSMSEILNIERERLRQQSEQAMQRQLGSEVTTEPVTKRQTEEVRQVLTYQPSFYEAPILSVSRPNTAPVIPTTDQATNPPTYVPTLDSAADPAPHRISEGLSRRSRFVGESFPDMDNLIIHHELDLEALPAVPSGIDLFYRQRIFAALPFSSQRDLLSTICRLTAGFHKPACQITLAQLARASGIRNVKTLRKWLNNLSERHLIRYTPIHGDPRGPIIALIEPEGLSL